MAAVMTDVGKAINQHRLKGTAGYNEPSYIGWGTGAGTAAVADTALFTEASEARVVATTSVETIDVTDDTYQVQGTLTADGSKTITNVANFDAATTGRIHMKIDFTGVPLNLNDTIQFILQYQQID